MPIHTIDHRPWLRSLVWLVLTLSCYPGFAGVAHAAESVTIPGYLPEIGKIATYRIEKTTETDMSFWSDKPEADSMVMRGDFRQQTAVVSRSDKSMRVQWALSPVLPPAAQSTADTYAMNPQYANSLAAYGVQLLELETDLTGYPTALVGADQIVAHMESLIAAPGPGGATVPADSVASQMVQAVKDNPLRVVEALIPEINVLCLAQASEEATSEVGSTWSVKDETAVGEGIVPMTSTWTFESTDAARQTATFSVRQSFDSAAMQAAMKTTIDKGLAAFGDRAKQLTSEQMARARGAQKSRNLTLIVSLQDGSTVEALDSLTVETGGIKFTNVTHIWRDDQLPVLPKPPAWNAKSVSAQSVSPLAQTTTLPSDLEKLSSEPGAKSTAPDEQQNAAEAIGSGQSGTDSSSPAAIAPLSLEVLNAQSVLDPLNAQPAVNVVLTSTSAKAFGDFTRAAIGKQTQVLIGGKVVLEPVVREPILGGTLTISGLDTEQAKAIERQLLAPGATITVRLAP